MPPAGSGTTPQWRLKLTTFIDGEARDEPPPAPLRRLSSAVGEEESRCTPIGAAVPLVRAVSPAARVWCGSTASWRRRARASCSAAVWTRARVTVVLL